LSPPIDPIGTENDAWLYKLPRETAIIVAAWGNDGSYLNRPGEILGALLNLHFIKMNKSGEPAHPQYLKADLKLVYLWEPDIVWKRNELSSPVSTTNF
jgi:hypothetical protein